VINKTPPEMQKTPTNMEQKTNSKLKKENTNTVSPPHCRLQNRSQTARAAQHQTTLFQKLVYI